LAFLFLEIFVLALTISKDSNRGMSNMNEKKSAGETNACVSTCHEASQGTAASGSHDKTVPRPIIRGPASQVEKAGIRNGIDEKKTKERAGVETEFTVLAFRAGSNNMGAAPRAPRPPGLHAPGAAAPVGPSGDRIPPAGPASQVTPPGGGRW